MIIEMDTREKAKATEKIKAEFARRNIQFIGTKLYVGDYRSLENPKFVIDRKQNLDEIYKNLCHERSGMLTRLEKEVIRAANATIKMVILCEHGKNIKCIEDVKNWDNPRLKKTPYAWDGNKMYREMIKFSLKYNVEFLFCDKINTGRRIIELLEQENVER